jgi:hypothetical protein
VLKAVSSVVFSVAVVAAKVVVSGKLAGLAVSVSLSQADNRHIPEKIKPKISLYFMFLSLF